MKILFLLFIPCLANAQTSLSFSEAYQKILEISTRTEVQKLNVDIAKAQTLKPMGQFLPKLSVTGKDVHTGEPHFEEKPAYLEASMNLFRFGSDSALYESTKLNQKSQSEKLLSEKLGAEDDALIALFSVIRLAMSFDVYEGVSKNREELLRIAEQRYQKGLLARQEVQKISVDYENAKGREADSANQLSDAEAQLKSLLNQTWIAKVWPWSDIIKSKSNIFESEFKLENTPQYRSAVLAERSSDFNSRSKWRALLPSVDLYFISGMTDTTHGFANNYRGEITLTIPLFDQLQNYSDYRQAVALEGQATAQRYFLMRDLVPGYEASKQKFKIAIESSLRREKNLSVSRKLYDDNFARFKQGRVSVNDLLIDQNRLSDAELLAIEGWYNLHLGYERLCHAGGASVNRLGECREP